jgi:hypothetical protein
LMRPAKILSTTIPLTLRVGLSRMFLYGLWPLDPINALNTFPTSLLFPL